MPFPGDHPRRARAIVAALFYTWSVVIVLLWLVTVVSNLDTLEYLGHVSGAWIALSQWATQGVYYPPLEFEGNYGGTRFGPLAIAVQAGAQQLTGDPIVGPKLLHVLYLLAIIAGIWTLLKPFELPRHLRLFLSVSPLFTKIGWIAGTTIRHDAFATALQLWAVVLIARHAKPTATAVVFAALLAALAALAKVSALWGGAACFFYLAWVAPKRLLLFVPVGLALLGGGLGLVEWLSDGHFSENMRVCLFPSGGVAGGMSFMLIVISGYRFLRMLVVEPLLVGMLLLALIGAWRGRRIAPHLVISFVMVCLMTAYLLTRSGIVENHLIDLVVSAALGTGLYLAKQGAGDSSDPDSRPDHESDPDATNFRMNAWVVMALLLASLSYFAMPMAFKGFSEQRALVVKRAVEDLSGITTKASARQQVLEQFRPDEVVISFNPLVPVLQGQNPIVVDSWMLRVYFEANSDAEAEFVRRVESQEFDAFVFDTNVGEELDFNDWHFGKATLDAVRKNYRLEEVKAFAIFRPIPRHEQSPASAPSE